MRCFDSLIIHYDGSYASKRFSSQSEFEKLKLLVSDIVKMLAMVPVPEKSTVAEIDRRLHFWRNPHTDKNSKMYVIY